MKRVAVVLLSIFTLVAVNENAYSWGFWGNSTTKTQTTTQIQPQTIDWASALLSIQQQTETVDKSVQNSFIDIVSNLSSVQDANTLNSKINTILSNNLQTQTQKNDSISELMTNYISNLVTNKNVTVSTIQGLSNSQKTSLLQDLATLAQSGQQYTSLAKQSIDTASSVMKTASKAKDTINTLKTINQTTQQLKRKAQTVVNVTNKVRQITSLAGLF